MDIGTLVGALGIGTLIATGLQIYFEGRRSSSERKSALSKEIYFKKIEAWEKIGRQITALDTEMRQYITALSGGQVFLAQLNISMDDRIRELALLEIWFSQDVRDAWNKVNEPYDVIRRTYLLAREGKMTQEQGDKCVKAIVPFSDALAAVKKKIRTELEEERARIV